MRYLLILFLSGSAWAESYQTVFTSLFKDAQGTPLTVAAGAAPDKGFLVFFWAAWCVPCKEELALVARSSELVQQWNVVAVNVDDAGGRVRADGILQSLPWPYLHLYDEGGAVFFQINSSGELPLALALDPRGRLVEVLHEIDREKLSTLRWSESASHGWEVSEEFHFIRRERAGGRRELTANSLSMRYGGEQWQARATHNFLRQSQGDEDEAGPAYLQWRRGTARVRLGDDAVEWGKGGLLSARALPGTDVNASLLGAHWDQSWGGFSLSLAGGRVRQQLFGLLLDPTVDASKSLARETAFGATARQALGVGGGHKLTLGLGALEYRREKPETHADRRLFTNMAVSHERWGLDLAQTHYFISESQDPALKRSQTAQVDGYLRTGGYQLGATYLARDEDLPRTFLPVLTEYPALPLTLDSIRSWRLAPRAVWNQWSLEPQWIAEQSVHRGDGERQDTFVLALLNPRREFKALAVHQRHGSDPLNMDATQTAFLAGTAVNTWMTTQLEHKFYIAKGRGGNASADQDGRFTSAQLGFRLPRGLLFAVTRSRQSGYYLGISGLERKELTGLRLQWKRGPLELRLAALQEPGGIVCSGGVCAQRPPLDGFSAEGKLHWNF